MTNPTILDVLHRHREEYVVGADGDREYDGCTCGWHGSPDDFIVTHVAEMLAGAGWST